jgi:cob(I)alamin adenosyltransferase
MANRLTKIYTRTGDSGETGTADGARISKNHSLIHAQGDIDELNSLLGLLGSKLDKPELIDVINKIQNDLFELGAEISLSQLRLNQDHVAYLEHKLDSLNAELPALKEFILPGGGEAASVCHLARAVCRRAERNLVALDIEKPLGGQALAYINRLSDLLFVLARCITRELNEEEVYWQPGR